jgi:hypothetical protein
MGDIANPLDMNRYVYARNNPIRYTDPSGNVVTDWDRNVMSGIPGRIERIQYISNHYNDPDVTDKQRAEWRNEVEGYRVRYRNENEYTDSSGITRSKDTDGEIKFQNNSQTLGTGTLYIKVGYSIDRQNQVVLDKNGYRQSAYIVSGGIGTKYNTDTQSFTTNGSTIFWDVTYSITTTYTIPLTPWEHNYKTTGGHVYGTFYSLK